MTVGCKSEQQRAAEARARALLKERDTLGISAFERLQAKRRAARLERVRDRTRAAVLARQTGTTPIPDTLPFPEAS